MNEQTLKHLMGICLSLLEEVDLAVTSSLVQNEQFVLDFYDKINEISVRK